MAKFAGVSELVFLGLSKAADSVGSEQTDINMRPRLGPLASLDYKPSEWRYLVVFSSVPTGGNATIKLLQDGALIASEAVALNGNATISNRRSVPVSAVSGEAQLSVEIEITTGSNAGVVATVHSVLSVEQPLAISGC
jgi:hypothetical protein